MSPSFARIAPTYDALRPLSAEDRARLVTMMREASVGAGDLVVEVGCGTGRLTLPMAGLTTARAMGVETGDSMPAVARAKDVPGRVGRATGRAFRTPGAAGSTGLVVMGKGIPPLRPP